MYQSTQIPATQKKPKLLDQVRFTLKTKHYSLRTEESYIKWITGFIFFHNKRHPTEMGTSEVNSFLTHLAVKENVAASTQNQALCAIVFLYKHVLKQELGDFGDKDVKTTMIYTHVLNQGGRGVKSPADRL